MRQEWEQQSPNWTVFEQQIDSTLRQASNSSATPQSVNYLELQSCDALFRKPVMHHDAVRSMLATRSIVALKRRRLHLARAPQPSHSYMSQVLHAWRHMSQHLQLRKRLRKLCQARRRGRVQQVITEAAQAAVRRESRRLYMAIPTLAPKLLEGKLDFVQRELLNRGRKN